MTGGIDDAIKAMEDDSDGATKLPPIQYAKLRGLYPQKVYKAIRDRRLQQVWCDCGRKVVIIDDADKLFKLGAHRVDQERAESSSEEDEADRGELHDGSA